MYVIRGAGINDVWHNVKYSVKSWIRSGTMEPTDTRDGKAYVLDSPLATYYADPRERILYDPVRDVNPFFSLFESLWMLAGRDDADWLDQFVSNFSSRFADEYGRMHGAYGRRWRDWFYNYDGDYIDQLHMVVRLLKQNKNDRQAVIQMWDPSTDLGIPGLKDRPCNQNVMLRADRGVLDITVTCRSNDVVMGCYGANIVQFSMLQEYLASRIGIEVGTYTQFSNNWHVYERDLDKLSNTGLVYLDGIPRPIKFMDDATYFDEELQSFLTDPYRNVKYENRFFTHTALPMMIANARRRVKDYEGALEYAKCVESPDWREAAIAWLERRIAKNARKTAEDVRNAEQ